MQICPFVISNERKYKPLRDEYPYRLCVFDKKLRKVIDVKTEMEYDYIFISSIYFMYEESKKIVEGKRYAIKELSSSVFEVDSLDIAHAYRIIDRLEKGEIFSAGNDINNEDYLKQINSITKSNKVKNKRIKLFK